MGSHNFVTYAKGKTVAEAYHNAVDHAYYESGHDAYNGTISTTSGVIDLDKYFPKGTTDKTKAKIMVRLIPLQMALETNDEEIRPDTRYSWHPVYRPKLLDEPPKTDKYARKLWFELNPKQRKILVEIAKNVHMRKWESCAGIQLHNGMCIFVGWAAS